MQVYGSTKSFNDTFSRSLNKELINFDILSHRPGITKTELTFNAGIITAKEVAY